MGPCTWAAPTAPVSFPPVAGAAVPQSTGDSLRVALRTETGSREPTHPLRHRGPPSPSLPAAVCTPGLNPANDCVSRCLQSEKSCFSLNPSDFSGSACVASARFSREHKSRVCERPDSNRHGFFFLGGKADVCGGRRVVWVPALTGAGEKRSHPHAEQAPAASPLKQPARHHCCRPAGPFPPSKSEPCGCGGTSRGAAGAAGHSDSPAAAFKPSLGFHPARGRGKAPPITPWCDLSTLYKKYKHRILRMKEKGCGGGFSTPGSTQAAFPTPKTL